jgi:hypothetical protein
MTPERLYREAEGLGEEALSLIKEILIKHDKALLEECAAMLKERKRVRLIGYAHPYGVEQLPAYAQRGEKWNTPLSSIPFDGCIKIYMEEV